jgi:hypothetical protein
MTAATGPKVSSAMTGMSRVTSLITVGQNQAPAAFRGHQRSQLVALLAELGADGAQAIGAFLDGHSRPPRLRRVQGGENAKDFLEVRGVVGLEGFAGGGVDGGGGARHRVSFCRWASAGCRAGQWPSPARTRRQG